MSYYPQQNGYGAAPQQNGGNEQNGYAAAPQQNGGYAAHAQPQAQHQIPHPPAPPAPQEQLIDGYTQSQWEAFRAEQALKSKEK